MKVLPPLDDWMTRRPFLSRSAPARPADLPGTDALRNPPSAESAAAGGRTTDYMRNLPVEHGVLPSCDERLARFQCWAVTTRQRITTEEHPNLVPGASGGVWSVEKRSATGWAPSTTPASNVADPVALAKDVVINPARH